MKKLVLIIYLSFQFIAIHSQNIEPTKDTLYLFFEESKNIMEKVYQDNENNFPTYIYKLDKKNDKTDIYFSSYLDKEYTKHIKNSCYIPKLYKQNLSIHKLNNFDLKDYNWLKTTISTFKWHEKIYMKYRSIFIVEIDSLAKMFYVTKVEGIEIEY